MLKFKGVRYKLTSPSSQRAWIEIKSYGASMRPTIVALLAEGVDRNLTSLVTYRTRPASPSSRRAWIEIRGSGGPHQSPRRRPPRRGRG